MPIERRYLSEADIEAGVMLQLQLYGGGDFGVLKPNELTSAVQDVKASMFGKNLVPTRFDVAAKYLKGLLFNHAFSNGNKRAGLSAALEFLYINGLRLEVPPEKLTQLVLGAFIQGDGRIEKEHMAAFFRTHSKRVKCEQTDHALALAEARAWMNALYAPTFEILAQ
jgi:death-on-curing protein